jgi:hypothetical protein
MIDFGEMKQHQEEGLKKLDTLQGDEFDILRHFCSLATEALLIEGSRLKLPFEKVVINAYRSGIALGLRLEVVAGEVRGR